VPSWLSSYHKFAHSPMHINNMRAWAGKNNLQPAIFPTPPQTQRHLSSQGQGLLWNMGGPMLLCTIGFPSRYWHTEDVTVWGAGRFRSTHPAFAVRFPPQPIFLPQRCNNRESLRNGPGSDSRAGRLRVAVVWYVGRLVGRKPDRDSRECASKAPCAPH
jgi:hypothetical protein